MYYCVSLTSNFHFRLFLSIQIVVVVLCFPYSIGEDYYELLGVPKNANNREIRKAFKKLAVTMHPDKNQVCVCLVADTKTIVIKIFWLILEPKFRIWNIPLIS